jgi:hypothetical protein
VIQDAGYNSDPAMRALVSWVFNIAFSSAHSHVSNSHKFVIHSTVSDQSGQVTYGSSEMGRVTPHGTSREPPTYSLQTQMHILIELLVLSRSRTTLLYEPRGPPPQNEYPSATAD